MVSKFLVSSSQAVFVGSLVSPSMAVLRSFSSPCLVATSGSLVFVSGAFESFRLFILLSICPRVSQLHQVTSWNIALGQVWPPAGHL